MSTDNAKVVAFYSDIFGFKTEWNGLDPNVEMTLGASRIVVYSIKEKYEIPRSN